MFHILMVVGKNEYLYASCNFCRGCRYLKECPRVMPFVSISSPSGCCSYVHHLVNNFVQ